MTASAKVALHTVRTLFIDLPYSIDTFGTHHYNRKLISIVALVAVVPKAKLDIKGPTKSWAGTGSSGKPVHRIFCSECGSPIAHDPEAAPDIIAMKAGTFDMETKKKLKPVSAHTSPTKKKKKIYHMVGNLADSLNRTRRSGRSPNYLS